MNEHMAIGDVTLDVFGGKDAALCAAHPADVFTDQTRQLLEDQAGRPVICVNPAGLGASTGARRDSLEAIVDDLEAVRRALGSPRWVFWGLSGGGWLGLLWAQRHPNALSGLILESICGCFRARVADPTCALSPCFPAWRPTLAEAGLLNDDVHAQPLPPDAATEWTDVPGVGAVFRHRGGPALLVSPLPPSPAMKEMMPAFYRFDARPWLPRLALPTLVIAGSGDPVVPLAQARALSDALPHARFLSVEAGHVPTTQRHPAIAPAVRDFLEVITSADGLPLVRR